MIDKNFWCKAKNYYHCDFDKDGSCKHCDRIVSNPEKLKAKIKNMILTNGNMIDDPAFQNELAEVWEKHNIRLEHSEIQYLCDVYFQSGEQNAERLNKADNLFRLLDHYNSMLIDPVNDNSSERRVRIGYV